MPTPAPTPTPITPHPGAASPGPAATPGQPSLSIGISGSYGGLNLGDEAILSAILGSLREARPDAELVVISRNAEHTRRHQDADRVVQTRDLSRDEVLPEIERLDLFLLGGGGILYDEEARHYLRDMRLAQERGIPTFTYAVGAGPLDQPGDRKLVRDVLSRAEGLTVRDQISKRVFEDVGIERPVEVVADPALLLTSDQFSHAMLADEGVRDHGRLVGFSVREPGKAAPDLDVAGYHALLAEAADFVVHRFDADVLFVPIERDDIRHSHAVIGRMLAADRAHVLKGTYSPQQLLGLMDHLDLVVGMRLHFLLFAALGAVPFLPLPYAAKVTDFVTALGVTPPARVSRESAGPLLAAIDKAWDCREQQRTHLVQRLPEYQDRARRTTGLAVALLGRPVPMTRTLAR